VIRFRETDVLAALDVARKQRETTSEQAIPDDVIRLALWLMAPDVTEPPDWLRTREPSREEETAASRFAVAYFKEMQDLETTDKRLNFVHRDIHARNIFKFSK
jgi:hypothetical protein